MSRRRGEFVMSDAIIFAGGVARGAFGAGALAVLLAETPDLDVRRIVATSSGALNAAYLARAVRSGVERDAGEQLEEIWLTEGNAAHAFNLSVTGIASLEGIATNAKLLALLREHIAPSTARHPVELRLVATSMAGDVVHTHGHAATTFEHVMRFRGETFDTQKGLEEMFTGVTASAAFPIVFRPVDLAKHGERVPCFDGGLLNNAPIKHAIDDPSVSRVFVIASWPAVYSAAPQDRRGLGLVEHLADVLVGERLYRDVREAREVNRALALLRTRLHGDELSAALGALGWLGRRPIEIVEIRPYPAALEGGAFDGLFSPALRESYVRAGQDAALAWTRARGTTSAPWRRRGSAA